MKRLNKFHLSRLLVTITYVIFCTKYCGGWSIYTRQTCYTETWNRVICCWIPPVTLRSAISVWRESRIRTTITRASSQNTWPRGGTELRKSCLTLRYKHTFLTHTHTHTKVKIYSRHENTFCASTWTLNIQLSLYAGLYQIHRHLVSGLHSGRNALETSDIPR